MTYICTDCDYEEESTEENLANKGEPVCPHCNNAMGRVGESWSFASELLSVIDDVKALSRSIS